MYNVQLKKQLLNYGYLIFFEFQIYLENRTEQIFQYLMLYKLSNNSKTTSNS